MINRILQPQLAVLRNTPNDLYRLDKSKFKEENKSKEVNNMKEVEYEIPPLEEIIETLAYISKERLGEKLGFKPELKSKKDINLGKCAALLTETLIFNPSNKNIKLAIQFIELIGLIQELENVYKEKSQMETMGFKGKNKTDKEIKIGENALKLAETLKKVPTEANIKSAYKFLELVDKFDSIKFRNKIKEKLLEYPYKFSVN